MIFQEAARIFTSGNVLFMVGTPHTLEHYSESVPSATMKNQYFEEYLPSYAGGLGDSGVDLHVPETMKVPSMFSRDEIKATFVPSGVRARMHSDGVPTGYDLCMRSSMGTKTPLRHSNPPGIIDAGYRNEIKGIVDNHGKHEWEIEKGTRLFQLVAPNRREIFVVIVTDLPETKRGMGGFGSTGK